MLLGSGKLATELDRLELIDEHKFLAHPGSPVTARPCRLPSTRRVELVAAKPFRSGAVARYYQGGLT